MTTTEMQGTGGEKAESKGLSLILKEGLSAFFSAITPVTGIVPVDWFLDRLIGGVFGLPTLFIVLTGAWPGYMVENVILWPLHKTKGILRTIVLIVLTLIGLAVGLFLARYIGFLRHLPGLVLIGAYFIPGALFQFPDEAEVYAAYAGMFMGGLWLAVLYMFFR